MIKPADFYRRKSHMEFGDIYFWTASINQWFKLLFSDQYKDVIIQSLEYLTRKNKIDVFAFVIMPTHLHFIWRMLEINGKESPQASFLKYTAHVFMKLLVKDDHRRLVPFEVDASNKKHEFWQHDPLAIQLFNSKIAYQKLHYIHRNPIAKKWKLAGDMGAYKYSSASYYETGEKRFSFLKDIRDEY